jgi:hypothetical protein
VSHPGQVVKDARGLLFLFLFMGASAFAQEAGTCRALDLELQATYVGGCKNGLADGEGEASGTAHYKGGFAAGRKHGFGVKTWATTGDRYEGRFVDDRKEGAGTYSWGPKSAWPGEKYSGSYLKDRRHGDGVYEWPNGDRYSGPWANDAIAGPPAAGMFERARAYEELAAVVGRPGARVCREMTVGIGTKDWLRGTVVKVQAARISVRVDDAGRFEHTIGERTVRKGEEVTDLLRLWIPCR